MAFSSTLKRKEGPAHSSHGRSYKRSKTFDARTLRSQTSDAALNNGELNVEKFVKAREFEIRALEDGIKRSKQGLSTRAHQELPKELRRRTASHNAKRVPKRLQARAKREMVEDNTPTVTSRRRKADGHRRLRLETAQRLQLLSKKSKARRVEKKDRKSSSEVQVLPAEPSQSIAGEAVQPKTKARIKRSAVLRDAPIPPAKFRKRQIHKTWLPTHLWHSKRAKMTAPREPMWRFALPLTPAIKSYRNTHRAHADRNAIAWDMSYMATISLTGTEPSLTGLLRALGIGSASPSAHPWSKSGRKWRQGVRILETWIHERDAPDRAIAPVCIVWQPQLGSTMDTNRASRKLFLRIHPSAFHQAWEQIVRLAKVQKPGVTVDDLRFELGSIEITGPDASEALVATLRAMDDGGNDEPKTDHVKTTWDKLASISPVALPVGAVITMNVTDPRLRQPAQTLEKPDMSHIMMDMTELATNWPPDNVREPAAIFDRNSRLKAGRTLASRQSINRRKGLAGPGNYPEPLPSDSKIPVLIYASKAGAGTFGTWTVMLPMKCVSPVWGCLVYYPQSSGGTIRFGGLTEKRQVSYESRTPWFPADFPGTKAGMQWEVEESARRQAEWSRRPKGRRCEYDSIDLGLERKGELGNGWSCDWEWLCMSMRKEFCRTEDMGGSNPPSSEPSSLTQLTLQQSLEFLRSSAPLAINPRLLATVQMTCIGKGRPNACARVYRLPSKDDSLRQQWLRASMTAASPRLNNLESRSLHSGHLIVPGEEDLVGFVTTGNFSLVEGRGVGIASLVLKLVVERQDGSRIPAEERHICIVRDAGECIGRLARWELV